MGFLFTDSSPIEMIGHWGGGFWDLLEFAMQMTLVVTTGYILADTPIVQKGLTKLSKLANTPSQAIILVTLVASIGSWINYGFALVVGALIATYVTRRVPSVNFRLLVASAYSGFLLWHGGLSASAPLLIVKDGHLLEDLIGVVPATETKFSSFIVFIVIVLIVTLPLVNWILSRTQVTDSIPDPTTWDVVEETPVPQEKASPPAPRTENSTLISL